MIRARDARRQGRRHGRVQVGNDEVLGVDADCAHVILAELAGQIESAH
jgi:hypothetical protein